MVRAIRTVASGGVHIDPLASTYLVDTFLHTLQSDPTAEDAVTERERDVLARVARGFTNREIALSLNISEKTVETHKARAAHKLGLQSRADIVHYALSHGWLQADQLK